MRIRSTLLTLATAAVVVTGCGGDSTAPKALSHVGRYALVSVNGATLPLILYEQLTLKLTVTEGALTLKPDNTFTEDIRIDVVANGYPTSPKLLSCDGTYARTGNSFTMTSTATENCDAGTAIGTLDSNTLTVTDENETLVFRR
jgi:hypothetical protein